jgi:hypothetical protein
LSKYTASKTELCFNNQMHQIVWNKFAIAGSWIHFDIRQLGTLCHNGIPAIAGSSKD